MLLFPSPHSPAAVLIKHIMKWRGRVHIESMSFAPTFNYEEYMFWGQRIEGPEEEKIMLRNELERLNGYTNEWIYSPFHPLLVSTKGKFISK